MSGWSTKEIRFLYENYREMTSKEISKVVGHTKSAVDTKINELRTQGQNISKSKQPWTPEDEKYVVENFGKMTAKSIAKKIGRSPSAVSNKINMLRANGVLPETANTESMKRAASLRQLKRVEKAKQADVPPQYVYDVKPGDVIEAEYLPCSKRRGESGERGKGDRTIWAICTVRKVYSNIFIAENDSTGEEVALRKADWVNGRIRRVEPEQEEQAL